MVDKIDTEVFEGFAKLKELRLAHRRLDEEIEEAAESPATDQLELRRLKKRKLQLKDMIAHLESELIPDLNA
ncbi:MAG: YdcH family protein [Pseudomonadota bacterium]